MSATVRDASVAGLFYPGAPSALEADVRRHLVNASARSGEATVPKAIIVPHAGYMYSGAIAGNGYARLAAARTTIRRVVLFGPAHRAWVRGLALPSARAFATPLGGIEVDREAVTRALALPQVVQSDAAHAQEHSLEVQLPFLQQVLDSFRIVPFAVGDASAIEVAAVMELLWGGPETLIVVSSDLSHYHPYAEARTIDRGRSIRSSQCRANSITSRRAARRRSMDCWSPRGAMRFGPSFSICAIRAIPLATSPASWVTRRSRSSAMLRMTGRRRMRRAHRAGPDDG
jgi:AmmeMemoRadiSam system protein B